jgi:regulatory protein YycI of two-component signal transduction system YycFG
MVYDPPKSMDKNDDRSIIQENKKRFETNEAFIHQASFKGTRYRFWTGESGSRALNRNDRMQKMITI